MVGELIKKHASKPFNPDIANSFFRCGYIESWGRGTIKMIESCKEKNLPAPSFHYENPDFWIIFKKDIYNEEYLSNMDLNKRQIAALIFWKDKQEITNSDYKEKFKISESTSLRDLRELVEKGFLSKVGDRKSTKYVYV